MAAIVKIKTNILKLKTGIALLVFSFFFLPSYAQPIVAHGYEFTYGEDSTLWIDIDSSSVYYESFLHNANAESFPLPFDAYAKEAVALARKTIARSELPEDHLILI